MVRLNKASFQTMAWTVYMAANKLPGLKKVTAKPGSVLDMALNRVLGTENVLDRLDQLALSQMRVLRVPELKPIFGGFMIPPITEDALGSATRATNERGLTTSFFPEFRPLIGFDPNKIGDDLQMRDAVNHSLREGWRRSQLQLDKLLSGIVINKGTPVARLGGRIQPGKTIVGTVINKGTPVLRSGEGSDEGAE